MNDDLAAYLRRLGYDAAPPATLETLVAVHRAHLDTVPYENLDIMLGRPTPPDPATVVARLGAGGRAGYCFHQNGALGALLHGLGYDVERRHGHVYTLWQDRFDTSLNHLVLVVRGLPTEAHPDGSWWPDVGLGEGFRDPVALVAGRLAEPGFDLELTAVDAGQWSYRNDPRGSFTGLEVRDLPMDIGSAHRHLSTSPDSPFTRILVVQLRHRGGLDTVRGCVLTRVRAEPAAADAPEVTDLTSYDAWRAALVEVTRLPVHDVSDDDLRALFERMLAAHRTWVEAGRP